MKSGRDQMVIDPDLDEIKTKRKKEDYEYYELHSFVITQREIPWGKSLERMPSFTRIYSQVFLLKEKISDLEKKYRELDCFASLITFYTGFPNLKTMKALYEFLWPGASGENIQYLSSARDDIQAGHSEHSLKQSLKTIDEFFSYIVSPQTRLRRNTLSSVM